MITVYAMSYFRPIMLNNAKIQRDDKVPHLMCRTFALICSLFLCGYENGANQPPYYNQYGNFYKFLLKLIWMLSFSMQSFYPFDIHFN